jgi:hypothetical protein
MVLKNPERGSRMEPVRENVTREKGNAPAGFATYCRGVKLYVSSIHKDKPPVNPQDSFAVPTSIIEGAHAFSLDELLIILIVYRLGQGCTIPNDLWVEWTGRSVWQKQQAVSSLSGKGFSELGFTSGKPVS